MKGILSNAFMHVLNHYMIFIFHFANQCVFALIAYVEPFLIS